jgi:hypothetical protein
MGVICSGNLSSRSADPRLYIPIHYFTTGDGKGPIAQTPGLHVGVLGQQCVDVMLFFEITTVVFHKRMELLGNGAMKVVV